MVLDLETPRSEAAAAAAAAAGAERAERRPGMLYLAFGVVLPLGVIALEAATHVCAQVLFDPLPTWIHLVAAALAPLALLLVWAGPRSRLSGSPRLLAAASGYALMASGAFAVPFVPLVPFACIGILYFGIGLLPLAPFTTFAAALAARRYLGRSAGSARARRRAYALLGALLAVGLLGLAEGQQLLVRRALTQAISSDPRTRAQGVRRLRALGAFADGDTPLTARRASLASWLRPAPSRWQGSDFAALRYRVTGETALRPERSGFDAQQGGSAVGAPLPGLSLAASRIDGSVDADAGLAYLEWTFSLANAGGRAQEARAVVALPAGGTVSRLTLWIDGEEREAAFGSRAATTQAYREVVNARRDPVLVTTRGRDRVFVQCFPVPAAGEMRVRLGITTPLLPEGASHARLALPVFLDRNFALAPGATRSVWLEADRRLVAPGTGLASETKGSGLFALRADLPEEGGDADRWVHAERAAETAVAWSPLVADPESPESPGGATATVVRQSLVAVPPQRFARVVVVIDGSQAMAGSAAAIAGGLAALPAGVERAIVLAGDEPRDLLPLGSSGRQAMDEALDRLGNADFKGGSDAVPALERAWDIASGPHPGLVLWLHGPQPLLLDPVDGLRQRTERRPGAARLVALEVRRGFNAVASTLEEGPLERAPASGDPAADISRLLAHLAGDDSRLAFVRRLDATVPAAAAGGTVKRTSDHLVRLWAADEVQRLLAGGGAGDRERAARLALEHHLVTPVTGAVVLETAAQYARAGLTPVAPGRVPTVPEPETWALLAVAVTVLAVALARGGRLG